MPIPVGVSGISRSSLIDAVVSIRRKPSYLDRPRTPVEPRGSSRGLPGAARGRSPSRIGDVSAKAGNRVARGGTQQEPSAYGFDNTLNSGQEGRTASSQ
jgi:hypothetical protein